MRLPCPANYHSFSVPSGTEVELVATYGTRIEYLWNGKLLSLDPDGPRNRPNDK